jgi:hypothetical protein
MNKYRSATLALAAAAATVAAAACSSGTPSSSSASSSSTGTAAPVMSAPAPTSGAPIPGRTLTVQGKLGSFPVPKAAEVGEDISGGSALILVFGSIAPPDVSRFYATALPQAGYTVSSNSLVSSRGQNGALIVFSGHGYKGNIESVDQGPNIAGLGGQNETTIIISPTK